METPREISRFAWNFLWYKTGTAMLHDRK